MNCGLLGLQMSTLVFGSVNSWALNIDKRFKMDNSWHWWYYSLYSAKWLSFFRYFYCLYFCGCFIRESWQYIPLLYETSLWYEGKVKSSRPCLRETRDKRPLGKDQEKSWCHRHTSVKLSWSQPMDPWSEQQHTRMLPPMLMEPCAATK